jgi:VanZ family protein
MVGIHISRFGGGTIAKFLIALRRRNMKLMKTYDRLSARLQAWGADKWMHVLSCVLIAEIVGAIAGRWADAIIAALCGFDAALIVGVAKECFDVWRGEELDEKDLLADTYGAVIGAVMVLIM